MTHNADFILLSASDRLLTVSNRDFSIIGTTALKSGSRVTFTSDDLRGFLPLAGRPEIAVLEFVVPVEAVRLSNGSPTAETFQVAILNDRLTENAKFIDPSSLRLNGEPVERTFDGRILASLGTVTGFCCDNLVLTFNTRALKGHDLKLEGRTYAGIPIRTEWSRRLLEPIR